MAGVSYSVTYFLGVHIGKTFSAGAIDFLSFGVMPAMDGFETRGRHHLTEQSIEKYDSSQPNHDCRYLKHSHIVSQQSLVAGCYPPEVLELLKQTLNQITLFINLFIIISLIDTVFLWGNNLCRS